jgi:hypothetical protein
MSYDEVIDPDIAIEALQEAMGIEVEQGVTILQLLNGRKVKVRYVPQSIGSSLEYDHGTPINTNTRKPKFDFYKWVKEVLPKMNDLALKNIQIVNDIGKADIEMPRNGVRLSLLSSGEFKRLRDLCFPGATDDAPDSDEPDRPKAGKGGKGIQRGQSDPISETV